MFSGESDQMRSCQRYADTYGVMLLPYCRSLRKVPKVGKVQVSVSDAVYIHCRDHDTHAHTGIA